MRLRVAALAVGVLVLLSAGLGVGSAKERKPGARASSGGGVLHAPRIDGASARLSAVGYLVSQGVPRDEATRRIRNQPQQMHAAVALRRQAPESVQSLWIDDNGALVAGVLGEVGERAARAAGVTPKRVAYTTRELEAVRNALAEEVREDPPPGFTSASFGIDPARGKVVAQYLFEGVDPVVPKTAARFENKVLAYAETGEIQSTEDINVAGYNMVAQNGPHAGGTCTAAWAVDIANPGGGLPDNGVMTAGHCFNPGDPQDTMFEIDTGAAGNTIAVGEFYRNGTEDHSGGDPGGDYGFLRLKRDRGTTELFNGRVVEAVSEPLVGMTVCKEAPMSGETCGEVQRVGVTQITRRDNVNIKIGGLVRASYCVESGDSGAPVYTDFPEARDSYGVAAVGIHSGSVDTPPEKPCESYFMPISGVDFQERFLIRIQGG